MPKLQDLRETKTIELPNYRDSKVEIYDSLLIKDMRDFNLLSENLVEKILASLPKYIKSWNFVKADESPLEITPENVGLLKQEDVEFILKAVANFREETKKKQSH